MHQIIIIGSGPAGLTAATVAAERGHEVHLFDTAAAIGGQLNMAKVVPGKEEFHEMLRYLSTRVQDTGVHLHLNQRVQAADLMDYDEVVIATKVAGSMQDILRITAQTTTSTQQTAVSIGELTELATELKGSVSGFKV